MSDSGLGRTFSRDVEAILNTISIGAQLGETYLYPWEVRENLRRAGMILDRKVSEMDFSDTFPDDHEPDFGEPVEPVDDDDLEEAA